MVLTCRMNGARCAAIALGAFFGLLTSVRDLSNQAYSSHSAEIAAKDGLPRRFRHSFDKYLVKSHQGPVDLNEGIIDDNPKAANVPKPKPTSFTVDTSAMGAVVNPHPFYYSVEPTAACKHPDLFLVAYVHTAPDHYDRRVQIRKTWANTSLYKDINMEVFFMVGRTGSDETEKKIRLEAEQYQDIVQETYIDAYHNLSYKAVGAMRWISTRCKQAKFALKTDDDVFINTFALIKHLKDLYEARVNSTGLLMCLVWQKMHVLREGKWKIDKQVIPDEYYPPYCSGMGYVMSLDIAVAIYKTAPYVPFFWVDDVYITGMIPKKMTLKHVDIVRLFMGRKEVDWILSGKDWHKYLFCHLRDMPLYLTMWKKLENRALTERIPDMSKIVAGQIATNYGPKKPPETKKDKKKPDKIHKKPQQLLGSDVI